MGKFQALGENFKNQKSNEKCQKYRFLPGFRAEKKKYTFKTKKKTPSGSTGLHVLWKFQPDRVKADQMQACQLARQLADEKVK